MPIVLVLTLVNIALIVHAIRSGRFVPWGLVILMMPGIGAIAYVAVELIPAWFGSQQGQQARQSVGRALDPDKQYRALRCEIERADTIINRDALAEECVARGRFREAEQHYDVILARPMGNEPRYVLGKARAAFGDGRATETVGLLDQLRARWPDFELADGHLLYARALEESGRVAEAADEYEDVSTYYTGAEPRVRLGLALRKLGREVDARGILADVIKRIELAPPYVRKTQAEWLARPGRRLKSDAISLFWIRPIMTLFAKPYRRVLRPTWLAAALVFVGFSASAQDYPKRPITMIVPFAAGGASDVIARTVAEQMGSTLGQTIVIENIAGAGGSTALTRSARAAPDGYTIAIGNAGTNAASYTIYPMLPFKPDAFVPIAMVAKTFGIVALRKDFPAKNLQEFIAYAKATPARSISVTPASARRTF